MVLRLFGLVSLFGAASSFGTGGCARALAHCGTIHRGDVVYYEVTNPQMLTVIAVNVDGVVECPGWIFEPVPQDMCPLIAYPYLVSLFAYAVMIASAVLMIVGWMATVCTDDSSCVFRAALAGYWFSNLGASIFAAFMVQTLHCHIGEGDGLGESFAESLPFSVICTNAYTTLVFEAPMAIVQHVSCIRRRGALFVTSSGMLGIMWSGAAFAMASDPKMGTLYGAHPLVVAAFSFLLELAKKMVMRQMRKWWCGFVPSKQLDLELGFCLRAISSPVPEDNHAPPPRPALRRSNLKFLTGSFGKLSLSRKSSQQSSRHSTDDSTSPCAETFESEQPEEEREADPEGTV